MIPDSIVRRFNIKKVGSVRRGDYMLAYGHACQVDKLEMVKDGAAYTVHITCHDIFTSEPIRVQTHRSGEPLYTFELERAQHVVLLVDDGGVLTDTDDVIFSHDRGVATLPDCTPGAVLHTACAPMCYRGALWSDRRILEKITAPTGPLDIDRVLNTMCE